MEIKIDYDRTSEHEILLKVSVSDTGIGIKKEDLKLINGKIDGLDTQIENIKKENDFLFEKTVKGAPDFTSGGNGGGATPTVKSIGEKLGERITSNSEASKKVDNFFS